MFSTRSRASVRHRLAVATARSAASSSIAGSRSMLPLIWSRAGEPAPGGWKGTSDRLSRAGGTTPATVL